MKRMKLMSSYVSVTDSTGHLNLFVEDILLCYETKRHQSSTGLFISPSGISELDCATTKTDTAERSISIGRESLQVFFFLY